MKLLTRQWVGLSLLVAIIVGLAVLGGQKSRSVDGSVGGKVQVAASFYPLYDMARNVGGDKVAVTNVTPAGAEPHDYEPTPTQITGILKSNVLIYDGAKMEPWIGSVQKDYKGINVKASRGIDLRPLNDPNEVSTGLSDPHFWLDPVLAQVVVNNIRDGLIQADPGDRVYFEARAKEYNEQLVRLDSDFRTGLAVCSQRTIVTSHAAFGYLGKRYNLDVVSIAGMSPEEEPSAAKLAELSQLVREKHINYVFFESLVSPKLAQTIASEAGVKTAVFDPIEGLTDQAQQKGKDYVSVQRDNLASLRTALACR